MALDYGPYEASVRGERTAEHRWVGSSAENERRIEVGDVVILEEREPGQGEGARTGRTHRRTVTHIDVGPAFGIRFNYALIHLAQPFLED